MADATARLAVTLEDETSGAAESAASSLEHLKSAVQTDMQAMRGLQVAMKNLKGPGPESTAAMTKLQDELVAVKARIQANTEAFIEAGGAAEDLGKKDVSPEMGGSNLKSFDLLKNSIEATNPALGGMLGQLEKVKGAIGAGGGAAAGWVTAIAAAVAVTVAFAAALIKAYVSMAQFAVEAASAAIKQQAMLTALTGSAGAAAQLQSTIEDVASSVPIASAEVGKLAQDLYKSGKRGDELRTALFEASMEAAGLGKNVKEGSEAARKAMLPIEVQVAKLKENFGKLFKDTKADWFLVALEDVLSLFKENTSTSRALKSIVNGLLDPLFAAAQKVAPVVKNVFRGMVIGALLLTIGVLKVKNALVDAFGGGEWLDNATVMKVAIYAGVAAMFAFAVAAAIVLVVLGLLVAAIILVGISMFVVFVLPWLLAIAIVIGAIYLLYEAFSAAYDWIASLDFGAIAGNLIDGLVNGIKSGAGLVMDAIRSMGASMKTTLMAALGIASPSKVFAQLGGFTAEGMAEGIEAGTADVDAAVEHMVSLPGAIPTPEIEPARPASQAAQGGTAGARGGDTIINVNLTLRDAKEAQEPGFAERLALAMREAADMAGLTPGVA